jgi:hypothetical protein
MAPDVFLPREARLFQQSGGFFDPLRSTQEYVGTKYGTFPTNKQKAHAW